MALSNPISCRGHIFDRLNVKSNIISADHLPICLRSDKYSMASSSVIFFIKLGLKVLFKVFLAKSFIPLTFCLLKPQLFKLLNDNLLTVLAFILFLHFFLNFKKTEFAAATLICCPIILFHKEKKISLLDVKIVSDGLW